MNKEDYSKYTMAILFAVILYFTFQLLKPFIGSLLLSAVVAYIFYPIFRKANTYISNKTLCALIVSIVLVIIITVPLFFVVNNSIKEVFVIYTIGEQRLSTGNILGLDCDRNEYLCSKFDFLRTNLRLRFYIEENLNRFRDHMTDYLTATIFSLPRRSLDIAVTLFVVFFLFRDGAPITRRLKSIFSLKEHHEKSLMKRLSDIVYAIIYGNLVLAVFEGIVGGFAFWLAGIHSPMFWGIVMMVLAFLPLIGAFLIWGIAVVILFLNGDVIGALTVLPFGIFITTIDLFLKPKIIGNRAQVHPIWILLGVLGGVPLFGLSGFIIGPLVLSLLLTFIDIYEKEKLINFS